MFASSGRPDRFRDALHGVVAIRSLLDSLESELVARMRAQGFTWVELAEILDLTPQGAGRRHRGAARRRAVEEDDDEPFIP